MSLQFKIPQNVQREDQILSFLTFRQLGVLAAGALVGYFFYVMLAPFFYIEIWGPLVFFPCVVAVCVAFLEVGGVSFTKWALLFSEFNMRPRKRIWNNKFSVENEFRAMVVSVSQKTEKKQNATTAPIKQPKTLQQLVQEIDQNRVALSDPNLVVQNVQDEPIDEKESRKHEALSNLIVQAKIEPVLKSQNSILSFSVPVQGEPEKILEETLKKIPQQEIPVSEIPQKESLEQIPENNTDAILQENLKKLESLRNNSRPSL